MRDVIKARLPLWSIKGALPRWQQVVTQLLQPVAYIRASPPPAWDMRKHEDFVPECSAGPGTHSLLCADISALRERCKFGKGTCPPFCSLYVQMNVWPVLSCRATWRRSSTCPAVRRRSGPLIKKLAEMQMFFGLQITGTLYADTLALMKKPRCGVPDANMASFSTSGSSFKWQKNRITYRWVIQTQNLWLLNLSNDILQHVPVWQDRELYTWHVCGEGGWLHRESSAGAKSRPWGSEESMAALLTSWSPSAAVVSPQSTQ